MIILICAGTYPSSERCPNPLRISLAYCVGCEAWDRLPHVGAGGGGGG